MKRLVVGILAHVDAGKTTLSEGMLYTGGSIRKVGRVDNGDAFLDTYALEKKRGITIFSKQALLKMGRTVSPNCSNWTWSMLTRHSFLSYNRKNLSVTPAACHLP